MLVKQAMLAGRLHLAPRRFAVEEVPVPVPGPGEVLVAVKAAGAAIIPDALSTPYAAIVATAGVRAIDPADGAAVDAIGRATNGRDLDVAFDFAGVPTVREQAAEALGLGGVLVLVGLVARPLTVTNSIGFTFRGNQIRGHFGSSFQHVDELIALASRSRLDLGPSISGHVPLSEAAAAVARLEGKVGDPIRLVLVP